jgi:multicomponent Na+:H+ antiporter subunit D
MGTLETEQFIIMSVLMISSLLNAVYLLPIPFYAFFPTQPPHNAYEAGTSLRKEQIKEAPTASLIAIGVATLGCLILFIYPQPLYELAVSVLETRDVIYAK